MLVDNFDETVVNFDDTLTQIEVDFGEFKEDIIAEIKLEEVKDTADQFVSVVTEFNSIVGKWTSLQADIKNDIGNITILLDNQDVCDTIETAAGSDLCTQWLATVNVAKDQLDQITINQSIVSTEQLEQLQQIFVDVENALDDVNITSVFEEIRQQIEKVKNTLTEEADSLIGPIQDDIGDIFTETGNIVEGMKTVRDDFFPHFKTATLVLGSFFVVVLVIFLLGVCCGSCSKRGGSSASAAATLLFSTNILLILLAILLFVLTTIMFTVGALSQKLLCKTLEEPADSELLTFASPLISEKLGAVYGNDSLTIDIAEVIQNIHSGMALYPLLQLNYIYDINGLLNWTTEFEVDVAIQTGRDLITEVTEAFTEYKETFEAASEEIRKLGGPIDSAIESIKLLLESENLFGGIENSISELEAISTQITELGIQDAQVTELIEKLDNMISNARAILDILNNAKIFFSTSIEDFLEQRTSVVKCVSDCTMTKKINETLETIDHAFDILMNDTSDFNILNFFDNKIITPILGVVDNYVEFAIASANNNIGATKPLSNIYNATKIDLCQEIVNPFNAGLDLLSSKGDNLALIFQSG